MSAPTAAVFDDWYSAIARSPRWDAFVGAALELPDGLKSTGYLSGAGLVDVLDRLRLNDGETLAARLLPERIARMNIRQDLIAAGFVEIDVEARPDWSCTEAAFWAAASALDPGNDPAMITLRDEAREFLPLTDALARLLVTGSAPE